MTDGLTRRQLLAAGRGRGAAALGAGNLIEALAQAESHRRDLRGVEHIVVFMQENRSFDTYFGTLSGVRGFDDRDAIKLSTGRSVFYQPDPLNPDGYELPFHLDTKSTSAACVADTSPAWAVQHAAWNGGRMDNWLLAHRAADGNTKRPADDGLLHARTFPSISRSPTP
jgi:phospholipase C